MKPAYCKSLCSIVLLISLLCSACTSKQENKFVVPSEFEEQEYIWFSWNENGFLTGTPFYTTILQAIKEVHPYVRVRLLYGPQNGFDQIQMKTRIRNVLVANNIDTSRIELFYNEKSFGAIQDPGPVFLRNGNNEMAVADFRYAHPDKRSEKIDQNIAKALHLPLISSSMISEGGAWQTNGDGTLLLVESVELDRNKKMSKDEIEKEYKRVLGVSKIIWLKNGLKEEEWGKLGNGKYGIGTGGHIDEFCRFADHHTVLLAAVPAEDTIENSIAKESFERMEECYRILSQSTTQDGISLQIIRIPAGPVMTKIVDFKSLNKEEQSWFDDVRGDSVEFYLATGYLNFVIANEVVITARFWKDGLAKEIRQRDEKAKEILEKAFPGRKVVQIDCMPLHHDGAGLHCHSRNQPFKKRSSKL